MDVIPAFNRPGLLGLEEVVDERHLDRLVPTPISIITPISITDMRLLGWPGATEPLPPQALLLAPLFPDGLHHS